jgi:tetratricopeptide (TPR) repeat protein
MNFELHNPTMFYRYDRQLLAETVLEKDGQYFWVSSFLDFRKQYDDPSSNIRSLIAPAKEFVLQLDRSNVIAIMKDLSTIAERLAEETDIRTSITDTPLTNYEGPISNEGELTTVHETVSNASNADEFPRSVEETNKRLEVDPRSIKTWNEKGLKLYESQRYQEAIEAYDKAIEIDPTFTLALYNKGLALDALDKYNESIQCYDRVLQLDPNNAHAWYHKGSSFEAMKRYKDAIKCFERCLELDPQHNGAAELRAYCLRALKG